MMRLVLPLEIPSQNATKCHRDWRANARATKVIRTAWKVHAQVEMLLADIPTATGPRRLHLIAYRKRLCSDEANLIGGAKAPIDGLVDAGLLVDDRNSMAAITYTQRVRSHPENPRPGCVCTVVEITEGTNP